MNLADISIKRPVFATMIMSALVLFGAVMYGRLNVDMYPKVDFPMVTVTTIYAGASPETVATQISEPIEEALNTLGGIRTMKSTSIESVSSVIIEFDLAKDVGTATQEVRDRISTVMAELPDGVDSPTVQKLDLGSAPVLQLALSGGDAQQLLRYTQDVLEPELERIDGVGQIDVIGGRDREMHVWLRAEALRGYELTVHDVVQALRSQNLDLPGGLLQSGGRELSVRTDAQARSADDLAGLAVTTRDGAVITLGDIALIEDGFVEQRSVASLDGVPAIAVVIRKQSDGNTVEVAEKVQEALPELVASAPQGVNIEMLVDNSKSIKGSVETVQLDIVLGGFLAIAIIFGFLRDWRATLISALALPTAVIGTFAFVAFMGFTLNMMTTLALSLSIGILIDDAIVVIENIVRRRTDLHEDAMTAASRGTSEIFLAVLATTLSLVAVFVPVAFMDGMLGQFFYEFGLTVAFAVLLSMFVSFTLTPMLSSRFLGDHDHNATPTGLSGLIEGVLTRMDNGYRGVISAALRHRVITLGIASLALVGTLALTPFMGFEFTPVEDKSQFAVSMELPPGTPLEETTVRATDIAARLKEVPGVTSTFTTVGGGVQGQVHTAQVVVTLVDKHSRDFHQAQAMSYVRSLLANEANATLIVGPMDAIGGGNQAPLQLELRGADHATLADAADRVVGRLSALPGFVDVVSSNKGGKPELKLDVDRARAADLGVTGVGIATTVRSLIAGEIATQVQRDNERYDVRVQLPMGRETGAMPQLRGGNGDLIDLTSVVAISESMGPSQIDRTSRQLQITISANLEELALSEAVTIANEVAEEEIGPGVRLATAGNAEMLAESLASMGLAMFLAVALIYMVLASQFESFIHPFTIMVSLPFALTGGLLGLILMGEDMSIFGMIGVIMLLGLVTKNAILLVDYANQEREAGKELYEALENAGATRLRPILMTTGAMVFGMLPVAIGHGDGGELRSAMGVIIIGGLISSTVLTLVVVPVVYTLMEALSMRINGILWRSSTPAPAAVAS